MWQTHNVELQAYTQYQYNVRQIPMKIDQEIVRRTGGHFGMLLPKEMHYPHQQSTVNITKETLMGQSIPSKSGEGKVEESIVAHDTVDKCEIGRKSQNQ